MAAYYNEIDPYAAQWLRNLINAGHIAPGDVDERSIEDVRPSDLRGYTQCHFFAGIGVWSYALRRAGFPDASHVWTGSCPCQPFSTAGKGAGFADERHLWPAWFHLIEQCRPPVIFGEQVASPDGYAWLDLVQTDVEAAGYAFGPAVLPAAGFGAPHGRHRIFFVGDANCERLDRKHALLRAKETGRGACDLPETAGAGEPCAAHPVNGFWRDADWLLCRDGNWRPVEPGSFPLVDGAASRVGRLRAYGNAVVAPVAQEFIAAYLATTQ
ncbi:MAG: DNA cytosine methyltransferase [Burkholderiales bacterium]|nr:DNA cytosine methyltransferase [Burkholderiales bacterium]